MRMSPPHHPYMLLILLCTISITLLAASGPGHAFAQADIEHIEPGAAPTLYLHIPGKMIAGQTYQGIAVSTEPAGLTLSTSERFVHLASGSSAIELASTAVEIPIGKNHAIFTIRAIQTGAAQVYAAYGGLIGMSTGTVYSQSTGPQMLDIIMPGNSTSASDLAAFVFLKDANNYPARAPAGGVDIRLVGGGLVEAPHTVHIQEGETSTPVPLRVSGDGYVSAAAPGLLGDREYINYDRDNIHVRLAVAPDIVLPGGTVYYSVWLERDALESYTSQSFEQASELSNAGGDGADGSPSRPYHPPRTIAAQLQTTDTDVLRLTEHIPASKQDGDSAPITLHGGRATGTLYAGHESSSLPSVPTAASLQAGSGSSDNDGGGGGGGGGIAVLTVSVPGYGVASAHVCVGTVVTGTTTVDARDLNGTNVVRGPDGNYRVVESAGIGEDGGGDGQEAHGGEGPDAPSTSCGSETETFTAYAERIVRTAVAAASQENQDAEGGSSINGIITLPRELTHSPEANHIRLFLQPSTVTPLPPYSGMQGVVGFYHTESETAVTATLETENLIITTSTQYERITPVRTDYERITITASSAPGSDRGGGGLDVRPLHVAHPTFHTNAYVFPMTANFEGVYDVSAVSGGYAQDAQMRVVPPYETDYHLHVVGLPARSAGQPQADPAEDGGQPLFLVSIIDDAGRIIDIREEFGEPRTVRAVFRDTADPASADSAVVREAELSDYNAAVIYGPVPDGGAGVVITLEDWPPASGPFEGESLPVDAPISMELDVPRLVHAGEYFPITTHTVDSAGVPVEYVAESDRRDSGLTATGTGTALVDDTGNVLVSSLYDVGGAVQREIISFLNLMDMSVTVASDAPSDYGPDFLQLPPGLPDADIDALAVVRAGEEFELHADSRTPVLEDSGEAGNPIPGVSYDVIVPPGWSAEPSTEPGVFVIMPGTEGEFLLVVESGKEGFEPDRSTIFIRSEMSVRLSVNAAVQGAAGSAVSVPFTLHNGSEYETPFRATLSEPGHFEFDFPESFSGGYGLVDITYDGGTISAGRDGVGIAAGDRTVNVTAVYDRQVEIVVLGAGSTGSGSYEYGETVVVSASPEYVIPVLLPERISYWQGAPASAATGADGLVTAQTFSFRAESDAVIEPVFEPDYMRVYMAAAAGAAAGAFVAYRRFAAVVSYKLGGITDMVRGGDDDVDDGADDDDYADDGTDDNNDAGHAGADTAGAATTTTTGDDHGAGGDADNDGTGGNK